MRRAGAGRARAAAGRGRGFSLLEFGIAAALLAVLAFVLLGRLRFYQEQAELAGAEQTVASVRSALRLHVAALQAQERSAEIAGLVGQNPMDWLEDKPRNYVGEYYSPKPEIIPSGSWYYDKNNKNLVYLLNHLTISRGAERKQLNFKIKLVHNNKNSPEKTFTAGKYSGEEISLEAVDP